MSKSISLQTLPGEENLATVVDEAFLSNIGMLVNATDSSLAMPVWNEFQNLREQSASDEDLVSALFQTTHALSSEAIQQFQQVQRNAIVTQSADILSLATSLLSRSSPLFSLISSLCGQSPSWVNYVCLEVPGLLPPDWLCTYFVAAAHFCAESKKAITIAISVPRKDLEAAALALEKGLECLANLAAFPVGQSYLLQAFFLEQKNLDLAAHEIAQILYRIIIRAPSKKISADCTSLLSRLIDSPNSKEDHECESSTDDSLGELPSQKLSDTLALNFTGGLNLNFLLSKMGSYGVFGDILHTHLDRRSRGIQEQGMVTYVVSILELIQHLSYRFHTSNFIIDLFSETNSASTVKMGQTKFVDPHSSIISYLHMLMNGFYLAGNLLCMATKEDSPNNNNTDRIGVAITAMQTMTSVINTFHTCICMEEANAEFIKSIAELIYNALVELSNGSDVADIVGMYAVFPTMIAWYSSMKKCRDEEIKKREEDEKRSKGNSISALIIQAGAADLFKESNISLLERHKIEVISDLSRLLGNEKFISEDGVKDLMWAAANTSLTLLHVWNETSSSLLSFLDREGSIAPEIISPLKLLSRSVAASAPASFLTSITVEMGLVEHGNISSVFSSRKDLLMWPNGVPCGTLLCAYFNSGGKDLPLIDSAGIIISDLLDLLIWFPPEDILSQSHDLDYSVAQRALLEGLPLHGVLSKTLLLATSAENDSESSVISECSRLLDFLSKTLRLKLSSLSAGIIMGGQKIASKIEILDCLVTILHKADPKRDRASYLKLSASVASVVAHIWNVRRSLGKIPSITEERLVIDPNEAIAMCSQYLADKNDCISALIELTNSFPVELLHEDTKADCRARVTKACLGVLSIELFKVRFGRENPCSAIHMNFFNKQYSCTMVVLKWSRSLLRALISNRSKTSALALQGFLQVILSDESSSETTFDPSATFDLASDLLDCISNWGKNFVHTSSSTFTPPQKEFQDLEIALIISEALSYVIFRCNRLIQSCSSEEVLQKLVLQKLASIPRVLGSSCALMFAIAAPNCSVVSDEKSTIMKRRTFEICFGLRIQLTNAIVNCIEMLNTTKSFFPVEAKQRIIEEKLGFVDLLSSNLDLFIRAFDQSGEFLLGSASKNRFNLEDLFGCTASAIIMLLLQNVRCDFADISDNTFTIRLIQRCDQHKLFKTLAAIFSSASNHALQVLEEQENKSLEVPWIRSLLEVMTWTLRLCHAAVDAGSKNKISNDVNPLMLGPGNLMRCLVDNTFLRFGCTKWHTWTKENKKLRKVRGYTISGTPNESLYLPYQGGRTEGHLDVKSTFMYVQEDEIHKLWRECIKFFTSVMLTSSCHLNFHLKDDTALILRKASAESGIDFLCAYDYAFHSAIVSLSVRDEVQDVIPSSPMQPRMEVTSANPTFTRNGLLEAGDCIEFLAGLMKCVVSKRDLDTLEKSRPGLMAGLTSVVNASLYTLSKFLGASATAHELFNLVEEGGVMSKGRRSNTGGVSPISDPKVDMMRLNLHPLLRNGIQVAKHEAKTHAHYVSSCCICMTESDHLLSKKYSTIAKQPSQGSPTNGSLRTFKIHFCNEFTFEMEHNAASALCSAISFLSSSNPTVPGFLSFEQHELRKLDLTRILRPGTIIGVRQAYSETSGLTLLASEDILCMLTVIEFDPVSEQLRVTLSSYTEDPNSAEDCINLSKVVGIVDGTPSKAFLPLGPVNESISQDKKGDRSSIGSLVRVLHWCNEQSKHLEPDYGRKTPLTNTTLSVLAERALMLLVNQIKLLSEADIDERGEDWKRLNNQLYRLFVSNDGSLKISATNDAGNPLASLVSSEIMNLVMRKLSRNLKAAEKDLSEILAREARSPTASLRSPIWR